MKLSQKQKALVLILFFMAVAIRSNHINSPPFEYHPVRQFYTAIMTRNLNQVEVEKQEQPEELVAQLNKYKIQTREPQILQTLVSRIYRLLGNESFLVPRLISTLIWMMGGIFLLGLTRELFGPIGALASTAAYLFFPFGIHTSRAFMPEALMNTLFILALWKIFRYQKNPTVKGLILAGGISGLAVLIKFVVFFPLAGAFFLPIMAASGLKKALLDRRTFYYFLIVFLIGFPHYMLTLFTSAAFRGSVREIFQPHLLFKSFFWHGWLIQIGRVVGFIPFIFGLVSLALIQDKNIRLFLAGGLLGYIGYGLIFSYTTATHDNYQIALFTIILTACGYLAQKIGDRFLSADSRKAALLFRAALATFSVLILFFSYVTADLDALNKKTKDLLGTWSSVVCGNQLYFIYGETKFFWEERVIRLRVDTAKEIGRLLGHNAQALLLARDYGFPVMYYSNIVGVFWPNTVDLSVYSLRGLPDLSIEERFSRYTDRNPEFFIVEDMAEWEKLPDLQLYLKKNFRLVWETDNFLIFRLR